MQADHTDIITTDGTMECYVCHPEGGPWPAVFFYMDVPGIREELREMSRHIASHGYAVILPDLYYRDGRVRFDLAKGEAELQRMFAMGSKLTVEMIMRDTKSMIEYVKGNPNMTDRIGCVGYCMSGQFVVAAAGTFPPRYQSGGIAIWGAARDGGHSLTTLAGGQDRRRALPGVCRT